MVTRNYEPSFEPSSRHHRFIKTNNLRRTEWIVKWESWREDGHLSSVSVENRKLMEIREIRSVILVPDRSPPSINQRRTISENAWRDLRRMPVLRNGGDPRKDTCRNKPRAYNSFWIARARPTLFRAFLFRAPRPPHRENLGVRNDVTFLSCPRRVSPIPLH